MKKYKWHKISEHEEEIFFNENGMTEIEVSGKKNLPASVERQFESVRG